MTWLGTRKSSESVKHPVEYFSKGFPDFFSRLRSMCVWGGEGHKKRPTLYICSITKIKYYESYIKFIENNNEKN